MGGKPRLSGASCDPRGCRARRGGSVAAPTPVGQPWLCAGATQPRGRGATRRSEHPSHCRPVRQSPKCRIMVVRVRRLVLLRQRPGGVAPKSARWFPARPLSATPPFQSLCSWRCSSTAAATKNMIQAIARDKVSSTSAASNTAPIAALKARAATNADALERKQ